MFLYIIAINFGMTDVCLQPKLEKAFNGSIKGITENPILKS